MKKAKTPPSRVRYFIHHYGRIVVALIVCITIAWFTERAVAVGLSFILIFLPTKSNGEYDKEFKITKKK